MRSDQVALMSEQIYLENVQTTSSGWIRALCPRCRNPKRKFYLNPRTGWFNCFHCGFKPNGSNRPKFVFTGSKSTKPRRYLRFDLEHDVIPDDGRASSFLLSRGVPPELIKEFLKGLWVRGDYAVISDGSCHFLRALTDWLSPKYLTFGDVKTKFFNEERAFRSNSPLVLVFEGIFDVLCAAPHCSIAASGKSLSKSQIERLKSLCFECNKKPVFVFDSDVEPEQVVYLLDYFDPQQVLKVSEKDPGDLGPNFHHYLTPIFT